MTETRKKPLVIDILRVRELDKLLRGPGVNVPEIAQRMEVNTRTVHRLLATIRQLIGPTTTTRVLPFGDRSGAFYLQKYAGKPKAFFSS